MSSRETKPRRTIRACIICHKKKVRCDIDKVDGNTCSNCARDGYDCVPRERKRKRFTMSPSPPYQTQRRAVLDLNNITTSQRAASSQQPSLDHQRVAKDKVNEVDGQAHSAFLTGLYDTPSTTLSTEATETNLHAPLSANQSNVSYLGRLEYLRNDEPVDDESEIPSRAPNRFSETDLAILRLQKVSELPPRAIRESLLDAFWNRCYPWTPVVERSWVERKPLEECSLLLLNAMLLAGSRVSTPVRKAAPEDFYKKARLLFWMGVEEDPIVTIAAICLLHWWNPEGPEQVSLNTSGFWLRIAVGLAYQVGLHREPSRKADAGLRRRIWWSLVVCTTFSLAVIIAVR